MTYLRGEAKVDSNTVSHSENLRRNWKQNINKIYFQRENTCNPLQVFSKDVFDLEVKTRKQNNIKLNNRQIKFLAKLSFIFL